MKTISNLVLGTLALLIVWSAAAQTTYPEKSIRIVIGFPPGSQPDTVARLLGQKLTEALGKQVVIDNIAGAAGYADCHRVGSARVRSHIVVWRTRAGAHVHFRIMHVA